MQGSPKKIETGGLDEDAKSRDGGMRYTEAASQYWLIAQTRKWGEGKASKLACRLLP